LGTSASSRIWPSCPFKPRSYGISEPYKYCFPRVFLFRFLYFYPLEDDLDLEEEVDEDRRR
jgi:hypothetical protein